MTGVIDPERWARVKTVFHDALERSADEWAAFVAHACGDDAALRVEVERLLAAHQRAGVFIDARPAGMSGRRIGRYEVGRLVGAGGMGEVYLARDLELGRDVALKIASLADGDSRLRREAQQASRLNHPHICTIHEVGALDGRLYIVMEYVDGQPLSDLIPPEGLPFERVARYAAQVADGLAHAHERHVIHRDLKASNVVVTRDGRAKILDFGLARQPEGERLHQLSASRSAGTTDGALAGTLSYMSPELLRGEPADARSDIWALGVLLYEMAAGRRPFTGATGFELSAAILHERPAPLPSRVPAALRTVIHRCLEKNPVGRYQQADEVRSALDACLSEPHMPSRRMAAAALLGLVLAGVGLAVAWRPWSTGIPVTAARPAIAVMPFDDLTASAESAWLSKGVQSMLLTDLAQTRDLRLVSTQRLHEVVRKAGTVNLESLDRAQASDVARRAGAGAAVVGSIVKAGSSIRIDAQLEDLSTGRVLGATSVSGTDLFALVDQLAVRIRDNVGLGDAGDARPVAEVSSASLEAYRLYSQGVDAYASLRLDAARDLLLQAVAIDSTFAEAYLQLALLSGPAGRPAERSGYLRRAVAHGTRLSERRRLLLDVESARDEGRFADAARGLDELLAKFPDLDAISILSGQLYMPVVGPLADAEKHLAITTAVVAANPSSATARNDLAYALLNVGRPADAIRELEAYARLAPREPNPYDSLAEAYLMMGLPERSLEFYARAQAIDPKFYSGGLAWMLAILGRYDRVSPGQVGPPYLRAVIRARVGRYREAREDIAGAIRSAEAGEDFAKSAGLRLLSALLAIERSEYTRALEETRAARILLARLPRERRRFSLVLLELIGGVAEARNGRLAEARSDLDAQRRLYPPTVQADRWWYHMLEGEVALAAGELDRAAAAFARAEPERKTFFSMLVEGSVLANDLVFRDGLARVEKARGNLRGAVDIYRRLLTFGPEQKWVAAFEPRYVLEIARLLEHAGDRRSARAEYERFLQAWENADADLPEPAEARRALARLK